MVMEGELTDEGMSYESDVMDERLVMKAELTDECILLESKDGERELSERGRVDR